MLCMIVEPYTEKVIKANPISTNNNENFKLYKNFITKWIEAFFELNQTLG